MERGKRGKKKLFCDRTGIEVNKNIFFFLSWRSEKFCLPARLPILDGIDRKANFSLTITSRTLQFRFTIDFRMHVADTATLLEENGNRSQQKHLFFSLGRVRSSVCELVPDTRWNRSCDFYFFLPSVDGDTFARKQKTLWNSLRDIQEEPFIKERDLVRAISIGHFGTIEFGGKKPGLGFGLGFYLVTNGHILPD
ncbi:hypothetical protein CEXT_574741 [Caerostris extrusa]|uniref:Uncharacterized protein n=1 Tax=Caerostris extrusa TaxID=172846 RepID=A0AAV4U4Y3_CAEEX|nr:hypothetical protein CEXT_574741 [Caerostris extrusa]